MKKREQTFEDPSQAQDQAVLIAEPVGDSSHRNNDPVVFSLERARAFYEEARSAWQEEVAELQQQCAEGARAVEAERNLAEQLRQVHAALARERQRIAQQKERANRLASALKSLHRAFQQGNVFAYILKACMAITGATRGLYLTAWGDGKLRVRAVEDVDGYPASPPSPFLESLCRKVLQEKKTFVANHPDDLESLPDASKRKEHFRNLLVAPVVLLKDLNGIVLLADKLSGDFEEDDVDTVLAVGDQAGVVLENQRLQTELLKSYFAVVGVLADAVEAKDPYTQGHCELVAHYSRRVAERLDLTDMERSVVSFGGLLHDIGKIGISDGILNKPGKLMPEEWDLMRTHVRVGRDLLARVPVLNTVADVVLHHHERFDGAGYPEGLQGEQISLASRIVCVADAYCAMIAKRSYKESMTPAQARAELLDCRGTHFDPRVVDAFLEVLDTPDQPEAFPNDEGLIPFFLPLEEFRHALITPDK